jgi:hypothetical protein
LPDTAITIDTRLPKVLLKEKETINVIAKERSDCGNPYLRGRSPRREASARDDVIVSFLSSVAKNLVK